mgnify:FL=1
MIIKLLAFNSIQITTENGDSYLITDSDESGISIRITTDTRNTNKVLVNPEPTRQWENRLGIPLIQKER